MKIHFPAFNTYLLALALVWCAGCGSMRSLDRREATTLKLFQESRPNSLGTTKEVKVYRVSPVSVWVESEPFLDEGSLESAELVDDHGTSAIKVKFNRHGSMLLDNLTTLNRGRRIVFFSQFGSARWLGAPVMEQRVTDGTITFTPDATKDEAERIVRGLNNVAKELKKREFLK